MAGELPSRRYVLGIDAGGTKSVGLLADDTGRVLGEARGDGANLYTQDARYVKQFYEEVQAGTLWVNDPLTDNDAGPFGGMKMSGMGRELGEEGLDEFRETKHLHWDFEGGAKPWWYPYGR